MPEGLSHDDPGAGVPGVDPGVADPYAHLTGTEQPEGEPAPVADVPEQTGDDSDAPATPDVPEGLPGAA